jgi:DNA-3-methyladenine glycosylase
VGFPKDLERAFYERDSRIVARELLNKVIVRGERAARIVEVEAYLGSRDPGSHAYRGMTARNATMFGRAGHLYVYFTYGMHWCANAVCGEDGEGTAVLLRAAAPIEGLDDMWAARPKARRESDLCSGPAKLCQAFGIDKALDGTDVVKGPAIKIVDDGTPPPSRPGRSPRIGLTNGTDHQWRWFVKNDPNVSR